MVYALPVKIALAVALCLAASAFPQHPAQPEPSVIQAAQRATSDLYTRSEYQPDTYPPPNAAEWYAVLPRSEQELLAWPIQSIWTPLDFDAERPGLEAHESIAGMVDARTFARAGHRLTYRNEPAIELFVRASRIQVCDFGPLVSAWDTNDPVYQRRAPTSTMRMMSRLVLLDARCRWTSGEHRLAMERAAAVLRACRHLSTLDETGPLSAVALTQLVVRDANLMLDHWPVPGPVDSDIAELLAAITSLDHRDPVRVISSWRASVLASLEELAVAAEGGWTKEELDKVELRFQITPSQDAGWMSGGGLAIVHDGPLPIEAMSPEQIRAHIRRVWPEVDRLCTLMYEGGRHDEIIAATAEARSDPAFMMPLAIFLCQPTSATVEQWRTELSALTNRLRHLAP